MRGSASDPERCYEKREELSSLFLCESETTKNIEPRRTRRSTEKVGMF